MGVIKINDWAKSGEAEDFKSDANASLEEIKNRELSYDSLTNLPDMTGKDASSIPYFVKDLGQPVWWNGSAWVDSLGNDPSTTTYVVE